jgi:hypothetical protein
MVRKNRSGNGAPSRSRASFRPGNIHALTPRADQSGDHRQANRTRRATGWRRDEHRSNGLRPKAETMLIRRVEHRWSRRSSGCWTRAGIPSSRVTWSPAPYQLESLDAQHRVRLERAVCNHSTQQAGACRAPASASVSADALTLSGRQLGVRPLECARRVIEDPRGPLSARSATGRSRGMDTRDRCSLIDRTRALGVMRRCAKRQLALRPPIIPKTPLFDMPWRLPFLNARPPLEVHQDAARSPGRRREDPRPSTNSESRSMRPLRLKSPVQVRPQVWSGEAKRTFEVGGSGVQCGGRGAAEQIKQQRLIRTHGRRTGTNRSRKRKPQPPRV